MTYPAALVLIAQGDLPVEQPPPVSTAPGLSREPNHCSVPLTPPTSPQQPCSGARRTVETTLASSSRAFCKPSCCILIFFFSRQRLCDVRLQRADARQQHGGRQHQPKAFWEEAHLSGGPSGVEGMLPEPAAVHVRQTAPLFSEFCFGCRPFTSQLCFVSSRSNNPSDGTSKKEVPNGVATWDFNDLGVRASCSCSRYH